MLDLTTLQRILNSREKQTFKLNGFCPAAVLMPLMNIEGCEHILFTKRTETVEHHKGQISFPGGRLDDGENLLQCALRETHEEVGVKPADVKIIGQLDDIWTPTRYVVTPFVGAIPYPYDFQVSEAEIEEIILVPIGELLDPAIYEETEIEYQGLSAIVPYYRWGEKIIWGATGRILRQFLTLAYPGKA